MGDHLERIGQTVSDYRLGRWLGGGGFGNVYLAEYTHDGEQVALKVLEIRLTKDEDFRAFLNEARMMRLHHPHIVPLLDFGLSHEGTPFLVMEYAPLGTLRDRHPKGSQVPLLTVVEYAKQVASALSYAHTQRVVHRDVKPENMLVRADGAIMLSDFGIATTAHSTHSLSANQGIGGTIPYMAPEQLEGHPRTGSDQYALGIVIYEWLAGRCPFRGTAVEVAMQHAMKQPPSLVKQVPGLPQEVEEVVFRSLAKHPKDRFASVQAFLQALQDVSNYLPTLDKLSIKPFPKEVSPVVPPLATSQPVDNPPTVLPSSRIVEPLVSPPYRKRPITRTANSEPGLPTTKKRTLPVTGSVSVNTRSSIASSPPQQVKGRATLWKFGKRQIIAFSTGLLLSIVLALVQPLYGSVLVIDIFTLVTNVIGGAAILFLASIAGPWVGLFIGSVSFYVFAGILGIRNGFGYEFGGWLIYLGLTLFGFIPGLTYLKTHGKFTHFRSIAYVEIITSCELGIPGLILTLIAAVSNLNDFWNIFLQIFLPLLVPLILLPVALALYGRFQKRGMPLPKHASSSRMRGGFQRTAAQRGVLLGLTGLVSVALASGMVWFAVPHKNITEFSLPASRDSFMEIIDGSEGITAGPDGNLWFTDSGTSQIGRISPGGTITEFPLPTSNSGPDEITAGPDGNLWFVENSHNQIGRITPSGTITEYPVPTADSDLSGITAQPDGNLWFTEHWGSRGNQIGRITPSGTITEFPLSGLWSYPIGITAGPDGNLWFTEPGANLIGYIAPSK